MSSTTEILFNSPALHSLKRDQLVKLCKKHSLKASGKNVELIQRLRHHAQAMPKDSPLSVAARSDSDGAIPVEARISTEEDATDMHAIQDIQNTSHGSNHPRPSQQWEVVMDSIAEVEENSQGTLSSQRTINNKGTTGEFGTGSSKSSTVSSSIKALATSLGLKRNTSKPTLASSASSKRSATSAFPILSETNDELARNSTPYSSLPQPSAPPQTDHFTLNSARSSLDGNTEAPLPGHALRPGVPAPANARLSLGLGLGAPSTPSRRNQPTTTIRLISNPLLNDDISSKSFSTTSDAGQNGTPQLKPFNTTFDLILGSPMPGDSNINFGFGKVNTWPSREDAEMQGIYPTLTFEDLPPAIPSPTPRKSEGFGMPGSLTPSRQPLSSAVAPRSPDPFVFGSPLPQHNVSNEQFTAAAASVLDELNQRFREEGVEEITTNIIAKLHPGAQTQETPPRQIKPMPGAKRGEIKGMFAKKHDQEAQKMEGIDSFVKRRAPAKGLLGTGEEKVVVGKKRKSSVLARDSSGGGGDGGPRRPSVVARRASTTRVISNGRRAKALPGAFGTEEDEEDEPEPDADRGGKRVRMDSGVASSSATPAEDRKKLEREELEKEAIKKKLEAARARRRSSAVAGRKSVGRPRQSLVKPKPSRFGFLSSAKSLVQSVWSRGKTPAAPSNIPKATPAPAAKPEQGKAGSGPPVLGPTKKSSVAPARPTPAVASGSRVSSIRASNSLQKPEEKSINTKGTIASSRSRSPLPSFGAGSSSTRNSLQSNAGTRASRTSSATGPTSRNSSVGGTNASRGSTANVSSIGTRLSSARISSGQAAIGSMGTKRASSVTSKASGVGSSSRLSTSSRLFAPTASSLAKGSARPSGSGLKPVVEDRQSALGSITNSPAAGNNARMAETASPRPGGIFSKPLVLPQQSGIPTPVKKRTLSTASNSSGETSENKQTGGAPGLVKQRSVNGRKPRISRSKVIARLASQRAASGSSAIAPRASNGGKTRSSLGAKAVRASYGGGARSRASGGGNPIMSAKKRARQSEHARRKSRVGPLALGGGGDGESAMEIDD